jgi:hypothetical protein
MTNPVTVSLILNTPIANGAALNQTLGSAANLTLNGTLATASVATFDVARRLAIQSAGADAGVNWTVVGTDRYGNAQTETISGASTGTSYTKYDYKTITRIGSSGATAAGVIAGTNGVGSTPWFVREFLSIGTMGVAMQFAATNPATVSFQITQDDPNAIQELQLNPFGASVNPQSTVPPVAWEADTNSANVALSSISSNSMKQVSVPFYAWRVTQWTGTTSTICQTILTAPIMQGGPGGVF